MDSMKRRLFTLSVLILISLPLHTFAQITTDDAFEVLLNTSGITLKVLRTSGSFSDLNNNGSSLTVSVPAGQSLTIISEQGYDLANNVNIRTVCGPLGSTLDILSAVPSNRTIIVTPAANRICNGQGGSSAGGGGTLVTGSALSQASSSTSSEEKNKQGLTLQEKLEESGEFSFVDVSLHKKDSFSLARKQSIYRIVQKMYDAGVYLYPASRKFNPDNVTDYYLALQLALTINNTSCNKIVTYSSCANVAKDKGIIMYVPINRRITRFELYELLYNAGNFKQSAKKNLIGSVCKDISKSDASKDFINYFASKKIIAADSRGNCYLGQSLPRHLAMAIASKVILLKAKN